MVYSVFVEILTLLEWLTCSKSCEVRPIAYTEAGVCICECVRLV